jgi:2-polyprenyl-6-hydroxyphenyl methylase/3-demethylubiquinone-9 3-methyltransferase
VLVDVGCGGGLLAPHLRGKGYRHVGVDLRTSALRAASAHRVWVVAGDATALPLVDGAADVVVAGELLEHVPDRATTVAELGRVLRPGGRVVLDTLNATWLSRLLAVRVAELVPGVPRGLHDPALFVPPGVLIREFRRHGIQLRVRGVRPTIWGTLGWVCTRRVAARIVPTWTAAVLYQGVGVKDG